MNISGNNWEVTKTHLVMQLNDPYYSAWQRYNWTAGIAGYSVSLDAIIKAIEMKKKIMLKNKYGWYEITTYKASQYVQNEFIARDGTKLVCIPSTAFKKVQQPINDNVTVNVDVMQKLGGEFRKKYGISRSH